MARKYRTVHHELVVPDDASQLIRTAESLVAHFGEPFSDSSAIPTYLLSEFAKRHVKVILSGDGGDEMFAGYEVFGEAQRMRVLERIPSSIRHLLGLAGQRLSRSAYGKN